MTPESVLTPTVVFLDEVADWLLQADFALFDESHDGGAGDGFGLGSDAEDGARGHAATGFFIAPADGAFINGLAVVEDEGDGPGDFILIDRLLQESADAGEAFGGEGGIGGGLGGAEAGQEGEKENVAHRRFVHHTVSGVGSPRASIDI